MVRRGVRQRRHHVPHRRLQAGKREIAPRPSLHRTGKGEPGRIAAGRGAFDLGTARETKPQHLGDLVEGLADGVVEGGSEQPVRAHVFRDQQLAVAAGRQQDEERELDAVGEPHRQRVPLQVVDRDEGNAQHQRDRLRRRRADHDPADQARPGRRRDRVQVLEADAGLVHRPTHKPLDVIEVGARGDLGHHAAEWAMLVHLRKDDVRQNLALVGHQPDGGFVATGLESQYDHRKSVLSAGSGPLL